MRVRTAAKASNDLDGLRLLAMSRIPRCGTCPRFRSLVEAHAGDRLPPGGVPPVPTYCSHQVCAPLVARWGWGCGRTPTNPHRAAAPLRLRAS